MLTNETREAQMRAGQQRLDELAEAKQRIKQSDIARFAICGTLFGNDARLARQLGALYIDVYDDYAKVALACGQPHIGGLVPVGQELQEGLERAAIAEVVNDVSGQVTQVLIGT